MAAELLTPTDELTGMPLSMAPPLIQLPRSNPDVANWHHLWHPHSAPELQSLGGQALRNSRVQLVPIHDHNMGGDTYHTAYAGPPLPVADDTDKQFGLCVLACAGYVPNEVIDLRAAGGPATRLMTDEERKYFDLMPRPQLVQQRDIGWYRKKMAEEEIDEALTDAEIKERLRISFQRQALFSRNNFRYAYEPVREFFESYLISERMLDVTPRFIKKFLTTQDEDKNRAMGEKLLVRASVVSTSGLLKTYRLLYEAGTMNRYMPPVPIELVKDKLGNEYRRRQLIPKLKVCLEHIIEHEPQAA